MNAKEKEKKWLEVIEKSKHLDKVFEQMDKNSKIIKKLPKCKACKGSGLLDSATRKKEKKLKKKYNIGVKTKPTGKIGGLLAELGTYQLESDKLPKCKVCKGSRMRDAKATKKKKSLDKKLKNISKNLKNKA